MGLGQAAVLAPDLERVLARPQAPGDVEWNSVLVGVGPDRGEVVHVLGGLAQALPVSWARAGAHRLNPCQEGRRGPWRTAQARNSRARIAIERPRLKATIQLRS